MVHFFHIFVFILCIGSFNKYFKQKSYHDNFSEFDYVFLGSSFLFDRFLQLC